MGLLEFLHLQDKSNKVQEDQKIYVNGSNNKLTIADEHLNNQQQIELGLEIIIVIAAVFLIYFVGSKLYKCYKSKSEKNKKIKLQRLRKVFSAEESV